VEQDEVKSIQSEIAAKRSLFPRFVSLGGWVFMSLKTGLLHDLSAADLAQIDHIEDKGLFLVK